MEQPRPGPPYAHAPIVEAIVDVQVTRPERVDLPVLARIGDEENDRYPTRNSRFDLTSTVNVSASGLSADAEQSEVGYVFTSKDGLQIFHAGLNQFTFSRLSPYVGWEDFVAEAARLWDCYRAGTEASEVTRVAVRYINRFEFDSPSIDLEDYFRVFPEIGSLPSMTGFLMRVQVPLERHDAMLNLTLAQVRTDAEDKIAVLLDNDVARFIAPDGACDPALVVRHLEDLHAAKNDAFEACLTDAAREFIS